MRTLVALIIFIIMITVIFPIVILTTWNVNIKEVPKDNIIQNRENVIVDSEEIDIKLYDKSTDKVYQMDLEDYIKGVVAAEMPAEFETEALKAQAVAARTYAISRLLKFKEGNPAHPKAPLCNTTHCQVWYSDDKLIELHSKDWHSKYWGKIESAVESTKGEVLLYDGKIITDPLFHSTSGGKTEDSELVFSTKKPYLRSVESPYEDRSPNLNARMKMKIDDFITKIKRKYPSIDVTKETIATKIDLIEKSDSGRINKLRIDNLVISGRDLREALNLKSTNFKITISPKENILIIDTKGSGHGVGMSQWGANGMAENGSNYIEILKHYYTGVEILKVDGKMLE